MQLLVRQWDKLTRENLIRRRKVAGKSGDGCEKDTVAWQKGRQSACGINWLKSEAYFLIKMIVEEEFCEFLDLIY